MAALEEQLVDLTRKDADALAEMYRANAAASLVTKSDGVSVVQLNEFLIAVITSTSGVAIGYYKVDFYHHDALLRDPTVRMSSAKLTAANKLSVTGYGYSLDDMNATEHLLSVGQAFECIVQGTNDKPGADGLTVAALFGNPIGIECDDD